MALSRDRILKHAGVFTTREVRVPAWADGDADDVVLCRAMTVREFEVNQASVGKDEGKATAALIARCVLAPDGSRLFEDKDIDAIAELGLKEINMLAKVIVAESGLSDEDDEADPGKAPDTSPQPSLEGSSTASLET